MLLIMTNTHIDGFVDNFVGIVNRYMSISVYGGTVMHSDAC